MSTLTAEERSYVYGTTLQDRLHAALRETPWWAISLVFHLILLVFAYYYTWEVTLPQNEVELQTNIENRIDLPQVVLPEIKPVEKEVEKTDRKITTEKKVSIQQKNLPHIRDILKPGNPSEFAVLAVSGGVIPVGSIGDGEGLHIGGGELGESLDDVPDWGGWKNRCLAVWLFDESKSMKDDQQLVRQKVAELYENLGITSGGVTDNKRIVTAVCSFGKDFHVVLKDPTADFQKIREAIDRIPIDDSGKENYLAAVNGVLNEFSGYAKKYSRSIVIVLVTDEGGDDDTLPKEGPSLLEVTVARMKTAKASLLVFGGEAGGFGYAAEQTYDPTVAKGVSPWAWVNRGIESGFAEMLPHDHHFRTTQRVSSGFGPYGMSRLCRETGGVYYLLRAAGARSYDYEKLLKGYQPEIEPRADIAGRNARNQARRVIMSIVEGWNAIRTKEEGAWRYYYQNSEAGRKQMEVAMRITREWLDLINEGIKRMAALGNVSFADTASAKRWEANRDLMWAQIHKSRFQLIQFQLTLDDLMKMRNVPPPGDVGWSIDMWRNPALRGDLAQMQEERQKIQELFQKVIDAHDGTPWAVYARSEMRTMRGFGIHPWSSSGPGPEVERR